MDIVFIYYCIFLPLTVFIFAGVKIIPALVQDNKYKLRKANIIHRCPNVECNKLIREYQLELYFANKGIYSCPHCQDPNITKYQEFESVEIYDPWMDTVIDAPLIDMKTLRSIEKTIKTLKSNRAEMDMQLRFEEYHKLIPNTEWVKNISFVETSESDEQ